MKSNQPVKIGLGNQSLLQQLGVSSEKAIDKIYLNIINAFSDREKIRQFTILQSSQEDIQNVMMIEVINKLYLQKYCTNKRLLQRYEDLRLNYLEYLISSNNGRGREDYVNLFIGTKYYKHNIDRLQNKEEGINTFGG